VSPVAGFAGLPESILAPVTPHDERLWTAAPPGVWSAGEIVAHLASAMEISLRGFQSRRDREPMARRAAGARIRLARALVLGMGWFPIRVKAPETALPPERPVRSATEAKLRGAAAGFEQLASEILPARATNLFVKHPVLGDLSLEEWMRFHVVHAAHHLRQIRARLRGAATGR
jgi:hypothetical protein